MTSVAYQAMTIRQIKQTSAYKLCAVKGKGSLDKARLCALLAVLPCEQLTFKPALVYKPAPPGTSCLNKAGLLNARLLTVSASPESAHPALMAAIKAGSLEGVQSAIHNGADAAPSDSAPMRDASDLGHLAVLKYLVGKGADIDDDKSLELAIVGNRFDVIKYLLGHRTKLDSSFLENIVSLASERGCLSIVRFIIENGETRGVPLGKGCASGYATALQIASEKRHTQLVKYFLTKRNPEIAREKAITGASQLGHVGILKLLFESPTLQSYNYEQAMVPAINHCHLNVVRYLLRSGAVVQNIHLETAAKLPEHAILQYLVNKKKKMR
jgi:ankyrin repeat protein